MQDNKQYKKIKLKVNGMHCAACEVLIERKFKQIDGVEKVHVNQSSGKAELYCTRIPQLQKFNQAVQANGYSVIPWNERNIEGIYQHAVEKTNWGEIGMIFAIILAALYILNDSHILPEMNITSNMNYGFVFLIGVVAALSTCIAVTGGLLLAVAAKYNEQNPNLTSWQKFKPNIYFNIGRVVSYTVLGGLVGALGSVLTLSTRATGIITIIASLVMIILGFQMLKIFPWLSRFQPKMPKFLGHKIHDMSNGESKTGPFILGASTFFLPCGFTQALQLYVLSKGNWEVGALTMLAFSLGTLPALLSLSAISSFAKGVFQNYFVKFAAAIVIILGVFNINNGVNLTGFNLASLNPLNATQKVQAATDSNVTLVDGKQIVKMRVDGYTYTPSNFTIKAGIPVEWHIDGTQAAGCAQVITAPSINVSAYLPKDGEKVITFTPTTPGEIPFMCSMGMTTRGASFTVVPNGQASGNGGSETRPNAQLAANDTSGKVNPNAQQVSLEISNERGFYPPSFTVKSGEPVQVNIDAKVKLGGCMSTMIIPEYGVAHTPQLGKSSFIFTPTHPGIAMVTCSMGGKEFQFNVI